jgi:hypothetical protein
MNRLHAAALSRLKVIPECPRGPATLRYMLIGLGRGGSARPFLVSRAAPCALARAESEEGGEGPSLQHIALDIDVGASSIGCMAYRVGAHPPRLLVLLSMN